MGNARGNRNRYARCDGRRAVLQVHEFVILRRESGMPNGLEHAEHDRADERQRDVGREDA